MSSHAARVYTAASAFLLALAILFVGTSTIVFAQDDIGVKMSPTLVEDQVDPGDSLGGVLTITNVSTERQSYTLEAKNISGVDELGRPSFENAPDNSGATLSSWIKIARKSVIVDPDQTVDVEYSIIIPPDAQPGGHFGGIFIEREADANVQQGAGIGFQVGSLMSIQVNGDYIEGMRIREFGTEKALFVTPDVPFDVRVDNTGTVLQRPSGSIEIIDMFGNTIDQVSVNQKEKGAVLPASERRYSVTWSDTQFRFGKYTALLSMVYGQEGRTTITREINFWVVPVKLLGFIVCGLLALAIIFYLIVKSYVRRELKRAGVSSKRKAARAHKSFGERLASVMIVLLTFTILALMALFVFFS